MGSCLSVGCIPSKALLHVAAVMEEAEHANALGVTFAAPTVDILDKLRAHKDKVVGKLTGGLAGMAKGRKVDIVRGYGSFLDANHIEVEVTEGTSQDKTGAKKIIKFQKCIITAGFRLRCICPSFRRTRLHCRLDRRPGTRFVPKKMLVIGGGIIGLEMATVYSAGRQGRCR